MPLVENLGAFFADFNDVAVYNGGASIDVIFDKEYLDAMRIDSSNPTAMVAASSVPLVARGDTLLISAVTYKVTSVQPDGTGMLLLQLEKQ